MKPANEPILRVNYNETTLLHHGNVSSPIAPTILLGDSKKHVPLQGGAIKTFASIITNAICTSALSWKFMVSVLISGPSGKVMIFFLPRSHTNQSRI